MAWNVKPSATTQIQKRDTPYLTEKMSLKQHRLNTAFVRVL